MLGRGILHKASNDEDVPCFRRISWFELRTTEMNSYSITEIDPNTMKILNEARKLLCLWVQAG